MRESRRWPHALIGIVAFLSLGCATESPGTKSDWHYNGERLIGRVLQVERPVDIGGEGIRVVSPDLLARLVRVEVDARNLPLSSVLWVTINDSAASRDLLLSNRVGHSAVVGVSRGTGFWGVRNDLIEPRTELLVRIVALQWSESEWLYSGGFHGEPITDPNFPFPPYDRIVKLRDPRTNVRIYVDEVATE